MPLFGVSPLHPFTWSTQLKAIIDRLYPYYLDRSPVKLKGKESALILAAATDQMAELKGIQETYRIMTEYLGWKNRERCMPVTFGKKVRSDIRIIWKGPGVSVQVFKFRRQ